jgi:O-acetyl-ADP-ribose deacetylase (regulator of RNase III)
VLHEVEGDILLTKAQAIAHGVGPNDNFAQGLALSLRERWPAMYKDFRHFCRVHNPPPGTLWAWMGADGQRIINLFTQDPPKTRGGNPGRASLQNLGHCLKALHALVEAEDLQSVALPRLATGVGGLDWDLVRPELRAHLGGLGIPVIVYTTFRAGHAAREPL